jgi:hypothetical protein
MKPRSGGPRTPEGKAISSRNATKHGITSSHVFILQNENLEAWATMLAEVTAEFEPETPFEHQLIEEIAFAKFRLRRGWSIESGLINNHMDDHADTLHQKYDNVDEGSRQGHAFRTLSDDSAALANLARYQTRLERSYDRAVRNLRELRADREKKNAKRTAKKPVSENAPVHELPSDFARIT